MGRLIHVDDQQLEWTSELCYIGEIFNHPQHNALSIAKALVKPGITTRRHILSDTLEIYYLLKGFGEILDRDSALPIKEGEVYVWYPGEIQQIRNLGDKDLTFLCICAPRFEHKNYSEV